MADSKDKKSEENESESFWLIAFAVIVGLFLLNQLFSFLLELFGFKNKITGELNTQAVDVFKINFVNFITTLQVISIFVCVIFLMGIIYLRFRMHEVKRMEQVKKKVKEISEKRMADKPEPNKKWIRVQEHIASINPSDWRLSILEADILLNEVLDKMGYKGMTIGDKLKTIERSDFTHLDEAWEAHKIRNSIAHEGSDFRMSQNEAQRVISLYEKVFKEFYFI